jgi:four helix bundle protein
MSNANALRERVKEFAVRSLKLVRSLPQDPATIAVVRQVARSAPSISANYHSAGRARSRAEFKSRLALVVDEADETVGWLELLKETLPDTRSELDSLLAESRELRAIFFQALKTARLNDERPRSRRGQ